MTDEVVIEYVDKLHPIFTKQKRLKIVLGGRGSTKSTGVADYVDAKMSAGELWCCAREFQNSIDESVHRTLSEEIERLSMPGFTISKTDISHVSGGRNFYRGLSRNISSLKSTLSGVDGLWIEEGEDLTANTLRKLTASVRLNATDTAKRIAGEDIKFPEIIITMNRGSRKDPISVMLLARAEKALERCGYYEDEFMMVVEVNYTDMPPDWFINSGLEEERSDDEENMEEGVYLHKWHGAYLETVDNPIIQTKWFNAAIDAHKIEHLQKRFKPHGCIVVAHDPSGQGNDSKGFAARHGSIITKVKEKLDGDIDDGFDWAIDEALEANADWFVWDGDGMGSGAKRQVSDGFAGKHANYHMFRGSLSGSGQDHADEPYLPMADGKDSKPKTYTEEFLNNRAQYYVGELARRLENTYKCVVKGEYIDPDDMLSFDSEGVENMNGLRAEICRIPFKSNGRGLKQVLSKAEMLKLGIDSPNQADSVMMTMFKPVIEETFEPLDYPEENVV